MPFYGNVPTATATVAPNTNVVTITGIDLSIVTPGMAISFGARDGVEGKPWLIASVSPTGSNGGSLTTQGSIPTPYNSAPFLIDTTGYLGTDASYAAVVGVKILDALNSLLGTATTLYSGARQLALDKASSTAIGRILFQISGRSWGGIEQRALTFTPTGGQQASIETLAVRAAPDGTTWIDALLIDLGNGTGDLRKGRAAMGSAATVDLGSAPRGVVTIAGAATISSFGVGRNLDRWVLFADGGATLVHNAATLSLPGRVNIVTRAGDWLHAMSDAAGNWQVTDYQRADGSSLSTPLAFRNLLINPGLVINTRGYQFTSLAPGAYGLDRWKAGASGATIANGGGSPEASILIQSGSLIQVIEGRNVAGGDYVIWQEGSAAIRVGVGAPSGNAFAPGPIRVTGVPANTPLYVEFFTGGLFRPQFEVGGIPTAFERRPRQIEEWLCARYFQNLGAWSGSIQEGDGSTAFVFGTLRVPMRVNPTVMLTKPDGLVSRANIANITPTGIRFSAIDTEGGYVAFAVPTQPPGVVVALTRADGVQLSAEL